MEQKYLCFTVNPEGVYGNPISPEVWRALIDHVFLPHCDGYGFIVNVASGRPEGVGEFKSWALKYLGTHTCSVLAKAGATMPVAAYSLAEDLERLASISLDHVSVFHEQQYPADNLFFFNGDKVFAEMLVYEKEILFPYSTDETKDLIRELAAKVQAQFPAERFVLTERKLDMHGKHVNA
jgi:hypothetical protein